MIEVMRPGTPVEVDGLDADWVLDLARDAELMARQAERAKLRAANQWADIHTATTESGAEVWGHAGALDCEEPIGAEGTRCWPPSVWSSGTGCRRCGRWWRTWRCRRGSPKLVARLGSAVACRPRRSPGSTPSRSPRPNKPARVAWDVRIQHPAVGAWAGTSWLDACADSVDLTTEPRPVVPTTPPRQTARRWHYERTDDGSYARTSPHHEHYLVKGSGTLALTDH